MDLDEMLCVDRYRDMDELINFEHHPDYSLDPIGIIVWMPELDCFLRYCTSHAMQNFTSGKLDIYYMYWSLV